MRKIIIDTDIGDDVDDALAIALALNSEELEIVGITTVFRNTTLRAKLAVKLLKIFEREDIPVFVGTEKPLINDWDRNFTPPQYRAVREEISMKENISAVDFIVETIKNSKEKITLVPIGSLTNIALAILRAKEIIEKTEIVMMGGWIFRGIPEWNISCDPESARIVFDSGIRITMVPLDVTLKCRLKKEDVEKIKNFGSKKTDFLYELIEIWQEGNKNKFPILHDPLAIATAIGKDFVKKEKFIIKVETRGEFTRGVTCAYDLSEKDKSYVEVCTDVDSEGFIRFFMERILR